MDNQVVNNLNISASAWFAALVLGAALGVSGCSDTIGPSPTDDEGAERLPVGTSTQGIKDGTIDSSKKSVIGLVVRRSAGTGVCTGTLIAPNLVMTAQHCVSETDGGGVQCGSGNGFGPKLATSDIYATTATRVQNIDRNNGYRVSKIYRPPGTGFCGRDISLIQLNRNVPSSVTSPTPPRLQTPPAGTGYTAYGYGRDPTASGYRTSGVRRRLSGRQVRCSGTGCAQYRSMTRKEFLGSDGTCKGDSGGGAIDSQGRVLGALSRGGRNCSNAIYTLASAWKTWLKSKAQQAQSAGGYSPPAWLSNGSGSDSDGDGIGDSIDNCPNVANPQQRNRDGDNAGDACDDSDGDGVVDAQDNCPDTKNSGQADSNNDGKGDACTTDRDGDGVKNRNDNCPNTFNPQQANRDGDDKGDACDDSDNDGINDGEDNCPTVANAGQTDSNSDGTGDACSQANNNSDDGNNQTSNDEEDEKLEPALRRDDQSDRNGLSGCSTSGRSLPGTWAFLLFGFVAASRFRRTN